MKSTNPTQDAFMRAVRQPSEMGQVHLPDWATDLSVALESGACGQFVLYGNVHDRFAIGRYLGNLTAVGNADIPRVAVIMRGIDQLLPADGRGFEHEGLTYLVRDWALGSPFVQLPFASLLIADNLTDVEPLIVFSWSYRSGDAGPAPAERRWEP